MNIIDALKSGKPFRRKGEPGWYLLELMAKQFLLSKNDITADDWELKPDEPKYILDVYAFLDPNGETDHFTVPNQFNPVNKSATRLIDERLVKVLINALECFTLSGATDALETYRAELKKAGVK